MKLLAIVALALCLAGASACGSDSDCTTSELPWCIPTSNNGGDACAAQSAVGGFCSTNSHCSFTASNTGMTYCKTLTGADAGTDATVGRCAASETVGSACQAEDRSSSFPAYSRVCQPEGGYCGSGSVCVALAANGASCTQSYECIGYCNSGTCAAYVANDGACTDDFNCGGTNAPYTAADPGSCQQKTDESTGTTSQVCGMGIVAALTNLIPIIVGCVVGFLVLCVILPIIICCCCTGAACCAVASSKR